MRNRYQTSFINDLRHRHAITQINMTFARINHMVENLDPELKETYAYELSQLTNALPVLNDRLIKDANTQNERNALKVANQLHDAVRETFDPTSSLSRKNDAILKFKLIADSGLSTRERSTLNSAIKGTLTALTFIACMSMAFAFLFIAPPVGTITFPFLVKLAVIGTIGVSKALKNADIIPANPYEGRGQEVSGALKGLLRERGYAKPAVVEPHPPVYAPVADNALPSYQAVMAM